MTYYLGLRTFKRNVLACIKNLKFSSYIYLYLSPAEMLGILISGTHVWGLTNLLQASPVDNILSRINKSIKEICKLLRISHIHFCKLIFISHGITLSNITVKLSLIGLCYMIVLYHRKPNISSVFVRFSVRFLCKNYNSFVAKFLLYRQLQIKILIYHLQIFFIMAGC